MRGRRAPAIFPAALLAGAATFLPATFLVGVPTPLPAQEVLSWGGMQAALPEHPAPPPVARVPYGPGPHRYGELRLPAGPGPHPVAVVVHGGCWLSMADLSYMEPLAAVLNRLGWATWSLEFRRIDQDGGGWPGILEDVAAGTDLLREVAEEHALDLDRVVTLGHSSGGHLALWLAARDRLPPDAAGGPRLRGPDPLTVAGAMGLAPIAHLEDFARYTRCGAGIVDRFLGVEGGAAPGRDARLRLSDPALLAPVQAPQLLLFGEDDPIVPPAHGERYAAEVREAGQEVEVERVAGAGHFELVAPWTAPWERVESRLRSFLERVGSEGGAGGG